MTIGNFEIDRDDNDSLEEVEIFDGTEDFDNLVPIKPEPASCQLKIMQLLFGTGMLLLVFSFGYKIGLDEMTDNKVLHTHKPTMKPTVYPTNSPTIPTEGPTIPTEGPTISPTNETNSTRLLSKLTDPFEYTDITDNDISEWKSQYKSMSLSVGLLEGDEKSKISMYHKACKKYVKPPPEDPTDTLGWIKMLCRYYMPVGRKCDLTMPITPKPEHITGKYGDEEKAAEENLDRYTRMLAGKLKRKEKLRVATFGTSVMAGQDNCYNSTFAPVFQRTLSKVTGLEVEIFNLAQNGDGDAMVQQLICSDAMLDLESIDMIVAFWDMMPQANRKIHEQIIQQWLHKNILVTYLSDEPKWLHKDWNYAKNGLQFVTLRHPAQKPDRYHDTSHFPGIIGYPELNPWYRNVGGHWGKHDTGRCHMKTREGFDGVLMQNWHPGALTNQIYSDVIIFQILLAMNRIQDSTKKLKQLPVTVPTPDIKPACIINHGDMPNIRYDLRHTRVPNNDNPYTKRHEVDLSSWEFDVIKHSSNMGGCKDLDAGDEKKNHACLSHVDTNYGFVTKKVGSWITIKLRGTSGGQLRICRPNIKRRGMGVSETSIEVWANDKKLSMGKKDSGCLESKGSVQQVEHVFVSIKTDSIGFAFNSISIV